MSVLLGGEKAWKQRVSGDIVVSYQWVNGEPAMILFPKVKRLGLSGAYALCLSSAFKYVNSNGYPNTEYLIAQSAIAAMQMGMDGTSFTIRNIADAIYEGIDDLYKMPPEPTGLNERQSTEMAEIKLMADGDVVTHREVAVPAGFN